MGNNRSLPLSIIGTTLPILKDVVAVIDEHQKKKKVEDRLVNALKTEAVAVSDVLDKLSSASNEQLLPLLKTIHVAPTRTQLNEILEIIIQTYRDYFDLLTKFVELARKCKQVSINVGFMSELQGYDTELFDFVNRLAETVIKDQIEFGNGFYGFIQLYGSEPFRKVKKSEISNAVKEVKPIVSLVKNVIKPSLTRETINRTNRRELLKACKKLLKVSKIYKVRSTKTLKISDFVPEKLRQLTILFEENYPFESEITKPEDSRKKTRPSARQSPKF